MGRAHETRCYPVGRNTQAKTTILQSFFIHPGYELLMTAMDTHSIFVLFTLSALSSSHIDDPSCVLDWCGERQLRLPSQFLSQSCKLAEEVYKVEVLNKKLDVLQAFCLNDEITEKSCWNGTACSCRDCDSLVDCCIRSQQCTTSVLRSDVGVSYQRAISSLNALVTQCRLNTQKAIITGMSEDDANVGVLILEEIRVYQRSSPRIILGPTMKNKLSQRIRKELRPVIVGDTTKGEPLTIFRKKGKDLFHLLEMVDGVSVAKSSSSIVDGEVGGDTQWIYNKEDDYKRLPPSSRSTLHGATHSGRSRVSLSTSPIDSIPWEDTVVEKSGTTVAGVAGTWRYFTTNAPTTPIGSIEEALVPSTSFPLESSSTTDSVLPFTDYGETIPTSSTLLPFIQIASGTEERSLNQVFPSMENQMTPTTRRRRPHRIGGEALRQLRTRLSSDAKVIPLTKEMMRKYHPELRRAPPRPRLTKEDREILRTIYINDKDIIFHPPKATSPFLPQTTTKAPKTFPPDYGRTTTTPDAVRVYPTTIATVSKFPYKIPDSSIFGDLNGLSALLPTPPPQSNPFLLPFWTKFAMSPSSSSTVESTSPVISTPLPTPSTPEPAERVFPTFPHKHFGLSSIGKIEMIREPLDTGHVESDMKRLYKKKKRIDGTTSEVRRAPPRMTERKDEIVIVEGRKAEEEGKTTKWNRMNATRRPNITLIRTPYLDSIRQSDPIPIATAPPPPPSTTPSTTLPSLLDELQSFLIPHPPSNALDNMHRNGHNCSVNTDHCALLSMCMIDSTRYPRYSPLLKDEQKKCAEEVAEGAHSVAIQFGHCLMQNTCPFYDIEVSNH